jgi:lipid II:glycine glycyltransferase (peptidoglycan interpeptide bridge formation enzyme)
MSVTILNPTTNPAWTALVAEHDSDVFHSPQWMRVLQRTYGFEPSAVVVERDGNPVAGMAFCEIRDICGNRVVSLPFSDSCDPLVADRAEWNEIVDTLQRLEHPVHVRVLHNGIPLGDPRFVPINRARWHGLDLDSGIDDLWAGIDAKARWGVRKARREGVTIRPAQGREELRRFFDLHIRTRKDKYGLLAQPYTFFENIWSEFVDDDRGVLMVALLDGVVIGGFFFLEWKGVMHYKFSASNPDFVNLRANELALWTAIEQGVAAGKRRIDFGLSDWDQDGLVRFKRKFATQEKTITTLRYEPPGSSSVERGEVSAVLSVVTRLLTDERVPNRITEEAGDELYRYFA